MIAETRQFTFSDFIQSTIIQEQAIPVDIPEKMGHKCDLCKLQWRDRCTPEEIKKRVCKASDPHHDTDGKWCETHCETKPKICRECDIRERCAEDPAGPHDGCMPHPGCYQVALQNEYPSPKETPAKRLARGKAIREEVRENREAMKKLSTGKSTLKSCTKKKRYSIRIRPVTDDAPTLIEMGRHYLTDCTGPSPQGSSGSQDTKENTIRSILQTLNIWRDKGAPITKKDVRFDDATGEFSISDFFGEDGQLRCSP